MLQRWGFRHLFYEDNYPFNMATSADKYTCPNLPPAILPRTYTIHPIGDAYSPNSMCQPVPPGTGIIADAQLRELEARRTANAQPGRKRPAPDPATRSFECSNSNVRFFRHCFRHCSQPSETVFWHCFGRFS